VPGTFRYATATCRNCSAVTYYHREIGISAHQIVLLTSGACEACGGKVSDVTVSAARPAPASIVVELPEGDSVV
jgi:hypothetical protein